MSIARILIFLLVTVFMSSAFAEDYMADAEHYYNKGDYPAAIIYLKNQLKNYPQYAKARYLLGNIYLKTKKYKFAEKELNKAYQLKPENITSIQPITHLR